MKIFSPILFNSDF